MGRKITCNRCGQEKDVRHFYKNITRIGGVNTTCKQCQEIYRKERQEAKKN